jgi:hypothetical protein
MTSLLRAACALSVAAAALAAAPPVDDPALAAAIALARQGDFQGALPRLEEAVRRLENANANARQLAQGYLYIGISYLELDQEMPAVERFRAAALRDPDLRLPASDFSPQVIRFFDAARQEVAAMRTAPAAPSAPAPPAPTATPPPSSPPKQKKSGRAVLAVVGAGAAVAAGVALASGGGGDTPTTTTTTTSSTTVPTTTTTTSTTTTTTSTTTTVPAACAYALSPSSQAYTLAGGPGTCEVQTSAECRWSARSDDWITVTSGQSGRGNGTITFLVLAAVSARTGRVRVAEEGGSACEIRQAGVLAVRAAPPSVRAAWTSQLDVPGARGQLVLDGALSAAIVPGRPHVARVPSAGRHRVEATVTRAGSAAGTWRFDLSGVRPGSVQVLAGSVAAFATSAVVFHVEGRAGERLSFSFETP